MHKPKCNITRKYARASAAKAIQRFVRKRNTRQIPARNEPRVFTNTVQGKRLSLFVKRTDTVKRRSEYLNAVCSDAGVCIAFGKEIDKIKYYVGSRLLLTSKPITAKIQISQTRELLQRLRNRACEYCPKSGSSHQNTITYSATASLISHTNIALMYDCRPETDKNHRL
jgi:hypothetical protein